MEMGLGSGGVAHQDVEATGAYGKPEILKDLAGIERVIVARKL